MNEDRKQTIDKIVEDLRQKYLKEDEIDWKAVSDNYQILHLHSPRFFVPFALKIGGTYVVFTSPLVKSRGGIDYTAHEYGHVLLGHLDKESASYELPESEHESETNYFAKSLVGEVKDEKVPFWREWCAELRYSEASNFSSSGSKTLWQHYLVSYIQNQARKELSRRKKLRNQK